ncbi:MAG: hypothetical protein IJB31_02950 [Akkermansia sp.]|nr:hypothetical protein [Akkermansia sp.]
MKIWTYNTNDGWQPSSPPVGLTSLRLNKTRQKRFLIIRKEADGLCTLQMQLPEQPEMKIAISDLTEKQARNIAIAYLEQKFIDCSDVEKVASAEQLTSAPAMFPEWYRGNYSTAPDCMSKAAECLRTRAFSAGSGMKLIIADDADFLDESRADIILSASDDDVKQTPDIDAELRKTFLIRVGVSLVSALATYAFIRRMRKKN